MARSRKPVGAPKFERFDSVADFAAACRSAGVNDNEHSGSGGGGDSSWAGETLNQAYDYAENGNPALVAKAESVLDKIDSELDTSGLSPAWRNSVVGAFPNVPAYLANDPESMRHLHRNTENTNGEVNVYYAPNCSSSISNLESRKRGVTVLALVMALARVRPVNAYFFSTLGTKDQLVRIQTNPMVLSEAANALAATGFYRQLSYGYAHTGGWPGRWARWFDYGNPRACIPLVKKALNLTDEDLVIPPMTQREWKAGGLKDPVEYINAQLDKYRTQ